MRIYRKMKGRVAEMVRYLPEGSLINTLENNRYLNNVSSLAFAMENGIILEAKAEMCTKEHDLVVNLPCIKGYMPREEACIGVKEGKTKDIAIISRVGKAVCFVVKELCERNGETVALLSRSDAQKMCIDNYLSQLVSGEVIDARVTHIEPFGCFVDIGCGIPSMISIDEISVSRISSPADRFDIDQMIKVVFKRCDKDMYYITHKELLGTWLENADMFCAGETVSGIIRSVESYGIFVELAPNLAGLAEPGANVAVGQSASVYIKSINPQKMKIKLIIVDSSESVPAEKKPLKYFITSGRIRRWRYSPECCPRSIETVF